MADYSNFIATAVPAGVQTDVTQGGIAVATPAVLASDGVTVTTPAVPGAAGTYSLNLCNDTNSAANVSAIYVTPKGVAAPTLAHKVQPGFQIEPYGRELFQPLKLGEGFKVWITSDLAISVQLVGDKEG